MRLKKSIKLDQIERRKKIILQTMKEVEDMEVNTTISSQKINLSLSKSLMIKSINSFGIVFAGSIPILTSLTNDEDCHILVKWQLNEESKNDDNTKLRISWSEVKSDDIDQFDQKWENNLIFDSENYEKPISISVENKTAIYLFQVEYFDGNHWSSPSNLKSITTTQLTDVWDTNCKGKDVQITTKSIVTTYTRYTTCYLSRVASKGIHIWRFRIDNKGSGCWRLIGIWKTKYTPNTNSYFVNGGNKAYAFAIDQPRLADPNKDGTNLSGTYGKVCDKGEIVQMTLNLIDCILSFKIGPNDYGKAFDVEKTSYRAAVTIYDQFKTITLVSYQYQ